VNPDHVGGDVSGHIGHVIVKPGRVRGGRAATEVAAELFLGRFAENVRHSVPEPEPSPDPDPELELEPRGRTPGILAGVVGQPRHMGCECFKHRLEGRVYGSIAQDARAVDMGT
jgi:hypothetical protein